MCFGWRLENSSSSFGAISLNLLNKWSIFHGAVDICCQLMQRDFELFFTAQDSAAETLYYWPAALTTSCLG